MGGKKLTLGEGDYLVTASFRCPRSWISFFESHTISISEYARKGIEMKIQSMINGNQELTQINEQIEKCRQTAKAATEEEKFWDDERKKLLTKTQSILKEQQLFETFKAELLKLAPTLLRKDNSFSSKLEYLANISPNISKQKLKEVALDCWQEQRSPTDTEIESIWDDSYNEGGNI